jgi:hypothetical protein
MIIQKFLQEGVRTGAGFAWVKDEDPSSFFGRNVDLQFIDGAKDGTELAEGPEGLIHQGMGNGAVVNINEMMGPLLVVPHRSSFYF